MSIKDGNNSKRLAEIVAVEKSLIYESKRKLRIGQGTHGTSKFQLTCWKADLVSLSSFACDNGDIDDDDRTVYNFDGSKLKESAKYPARHIRSEFPVKKANHIEQERLKREETKTPTIPQFPLHEQCANGTLKQMRYLIDEKNYDIMEVDNIGWYPLHHAAWNGHSEVFFLFQNLSISQVYWILTAIFKCVKVLLKTYACSPNLVNANSMTALHLATMQGHVNVVRVLLEHHDTDIVRVLFDLILKGQLVL
jgi:hypothetical protein